MTIRTSMAPLALAACALWPLTALAETGEAAIRFEREVRPILATHCFGCHGPDEQKSGLRLDSGAAVYTGGSRGPAVTPGNDDSLILQAIRRTGELKMPPDTPLAQSDIDRLTRWVAEGAVWPEYVATESPKEAGLLERRAARWAYQPLQCVSPPAEAGLGWARTNLDPFVARGLEQAGLPPSPEADKRTLIRRLSYDLTGLPPSPEAVEAFVADDRPNAYEALVETYLAAPQYGERWARHWLDVVRYTDSFDTRATPQTDPVEIWRYRDWVVNAMNDDMPYDRFVRYQVAGDLMPSEEPNFNREGMIATGMLAIGNWPQGDADKQKMLTDIVDDQVDVVMRTFLGVTMACARCHDHKFDPISIEDYYGIAGIFFSSSILPGPGAKTEGSPISHLPLASPETLAQRAAAEQRLATVGQEREALLAQARAAFAANELARTEDYLLAAYHARGDGEAATATELNASVLQNWIRALNDDIPPALHQVEQNFQQLPGLTTRHDADSTPSAVGNARDAEARYSTIVQPAQSIVVHPGPTENVGIGWRAPAAATVTLTGRVADADGNCGNGVQWTIVAREAGVERAIASGQIDNGGAGDIDVATPFDVNANEVLLLTILPNGEYSCDTTQVEWRIQAGDGRDWDLTAEVLPDFAEGNPWPDAAGNPGVWWFFREANAPKLDPVLFAPWWTALREVRAGRRDETALHAAAAMIQAAIRQSMEDESSALRPALNTLREAGGPFWLAEPPGVDETRLTALAAETADLEAVVAQPIDLAVGIREGGVPGTEHAGIHDVAVHYRGEYTKLGDIVPRQLPPLMVDTAARVVTEGSGRHDLAQWLTDECAPLLARVMVNRVWQHHFGVGLVRTPGDFGVQGASPTHPELFDYLAAKFIESGWSVKALHRLIVNSATYRQSSHPTDEQVAGDPENELLSHMNRGRLDAEALRDSLMAVTGRLDTTMGGPAFLDAATPRRTLYLRTNRSNLNTYATLFDGADPTAITPVRTESIVAPQALYLMNSPMLLAAAEDLAGEVDGAPLADAVKELYLRLFARSPEADEIGFAETTLKRLGHPENAKAFPAYAQILLSSNEFFFID